MIIDSNIAIYAGNPANIDIRKFLGDNFYICSQVSIIEVLGFHSLTPFDKENFEYFFQDCILGSVDLAIVNTATNLKQVKKMSLGDSIIAATALYWDFPLFTNNEKDFAHIPGLQIIPLSSI